MSNTSRFFAGMIAAIMLTTGVVRGQTTAPPTMQKVVPTIAPTTMPATRPAMKMTVSPTGEIRLSAGDKLLGSGHWVLFSDGFRPFLAGQAVIGELTATTVEQDNANHALVRDTYTNARATTDIKLEGEDLRLQVHLQNLDAKHPLANLALNGFAFHFDRSPTGTLPSFHYTYLAAQGLSVFHPGLAQPVGAVYAHDDHFGFGVCSNSEFDQMTLFNAQFQKEGSLPAECQINFYTTETVAPGHAIDIDVSFRVSADTSITHLLEGYKKIYNEHFPALLYHADSRPVGQFAAVGQNLVSVTNPLGYGGPFRRLDSAAGTGAYIRLVAPLLHQADAAGIIFWSPGGFKPPMYPPDFDEFPKPVQENIPTLVAGFKKYGLRVGLCARCGDGVKRKNEKEFEMFRLNADDPEQMKTLLDRFDHAKQMGFDMFYLDSFGVENPNDQKILEKIRARVGKDVLLYTEFCTDMSLPYAGHYCEWRGNYILWTPDDQYTALRYLCPDSTWLAISRTKQPVPAAFGKLGLTPLVEDVVAEWLPASRPAH